MDGGHGREPCEQPGSEPALPLFRPEVMREQQLQWLGTVLLRPQPVQRWGALFCALVVAAVLAALAGASYTSKTRVPGWLVPARGLVRVFAPRAGVAAQVAVHEGEEVKAGQSMVSLSTDERSVAYGATGARTVRALQDQNDSLRAEQVRNALLQRQQRATLLARLSAMSDEQSNVEEEIKLQKSRLALAEEWRTRLNDLHVRGYISAEQLRMSAEGTLDQTARVRALERSLITLRRERAALEGELRDLPIKIAAQDGIVARTMAANERELAEAEARREIDITAPAAGTVTALHVTLGAAVNPGMPVLSIVPRDAALEAHLYAPSRAIGFVRAGQRVLLRFRAYPYQKFGHYRGVIRSVSRTAIDPAELPAAFAGAGAAAPSEPLYRITVALDSQFVTAYGKPVRLQPGMQLEADIVRERRRLYEWLLDPIYALTGTLERP